MRCLLLLRDQVEGRLVSYRLQLKASMCVPQLPAGVRTSLRHWRSRHSFAYALTLSPGVVFRSKGFSA